MNISEVEKNLSNRSLPAVLPFGITLCAILIYAAAASEGVSTQNPPLVKTPVIIFADLDRSKDILSSRDKFISALTGFDKAARLKKFGRFSEKFFLQFLSENALSWTADEKKKIETITNSIKRNISKFNLTFPGEILLIKTTGKEELGGIYTRKNAVIISEKIVNLSEDEMERQIIDSLLHIFLRYNPKVCDALCEAIGFIRCNEIEIPKELSYRKVTDPDAPENNHYINVSYKGSAIVVVPILQGKSWTCGRERKMCFSVKDKLLAIEKNNGTWKSKLVDSRPLLLEVSEVTGFYEKVGGNLKNICHPEEIVVDDLVMQINDSKDIPTAGIVPEMKTFLTK